MKIVRKTDQKATLATESFVDLQDFCELYLSCVLCYILCVFVLSYVYLLYLMYICCTLCDFVVLSVYCCSYFRCRTAG